MYGLVSQELPEIYIVIFIVIFVFISLVSTIILFLKNIFQILYRLDKISVYRQVILKSLE